MVRLLAGSALAFAATLTVVIATAGVASAASTGGATAALVASTKGWDVSYPQCSSALPATGSFAVVGVNDGKPWSANPCLGSEYSWASAKAHGAHFYMNTANPGPLSVHWNQGGPRQCVDPSSASDAGCAYDYGWNSAADAWTTATSAASTTAAQQASWWLDVETANSWNGAYSANVADLQGSIDYLYGAGATSVGIYSTGYQWGQITGGYVFAPTSGSIPDWVAGASSLRRAKALCNSSYSFSGGKVMLTQYPNSGFDGDWVCP